MITIVLYPHEAKKKGLEVGHIGFMISFVYVNKCIGSYYLDKAIN